MSEQGGLRLLLALMKIMSWNVRGLKRPEKRSKIKVLARERKIDVLLLQETKRASVDVNFIKSLWPMEDMGFMEVDAEGSAGGLLCIWNTNVFQLIDCCSSRNFILLSGISSQSFPCIICNIYAPNDVLKMRKLWECLINLKPFYPNARCLGGDFNEIRFMSEMKGCLRRERGMKDFNKFIEILEMTDLPMQGRLFTWCNAMEADRWSRIDRFLLDPAWLERCKFKQWGLARDIFDHCPILLMEDERDWGPKPFRFINAWASHPQFKNEVKKVWEGAQLLGYPSYKLMHKLRILRAHLRMWNKEVFGNIDDQLKKVAEELHEWT
ncbi:uncharacterized protein LOC114276195 [Camellia sinensis]|uniref:uncharacterized protein LOC114276195 n=1 Tax=Camellia sinensis TaxID=4442 RepID=UPI001035CC62|nr:uncharacterized protein LOC114276195 [Camellia sinensis]